MLRRAFAVVLVLVVLLSNSGTAIANQGKSTALFGECGICFALWCLDTNGQWVLQSVVWYEFDPALCNQQ